MHFPALPALPQTLAEGAEIVSLDVDFDIEEMRLQSGETRIARFGYTLTVLIKGSIPSEVWQAFEERRRFSLLEGGDLLEIVSINDQSVTMYHSEEWGPSTVPTTIGGILVRMR